jgi:hypothetical protein
MAKTLIHAHYEEYEKDFITTIMSSNYNEKLEVIASPQEFLALTNLHQKLQRIQRTVGYGKFNVLSFDEAISVAKAYKNVGHFTKAELALFEKLFFTDASAYGFYGPKVITNLTTSINEKDIIKVKHTGHYLFKEDALAKYEAIQKDMGDQVILTSGIRGIVKQMYLFLNKTMETKGNLTLAAHSLAPVGYSFHGNGDFDVGKKGFGYRNFTDDFAKTQEFETLMKLGYIDIRYTTINEFGVRFEPWHIKVS